MDEIDYQAEDKLVRRIDKFVVPTVMLAYLLCFLDRTNIGNARLFGLEEDLGLKGSEYQIAVAVLFVPYVLIEVPSNLVLKKFRPSRWLSFITVSWGIVSTCTGFVQDFAGLVAARVLLGLLEGGLLPGLTVYLTLFYTKKEIALRIGFLAWFLSEDEKQLLLARLQRQVGFHEDFDKKDAILAAKDWKTWINKRRKAGKEDYKIEGMTDEDVNALGDRSPRFVYTI
ncbi:putative MFS transporter [Emericellopsis cladophorae]|uniref:MFS transporter n=1 Tax=Emericellopsis cladophorae TaxID=2686198 RepID=A0A9P9Y3D1_9HYPO|nr:putative MFS transporter [Emericellopsis cladophorae]KAI6782784.1 putative MFS transporter [Emericellopsis cladophorae]